VSEPADLDEIFLTFYRHRTPADASEPTAPGSDRDAG
jgi:hypothetical protein